MNKLSIAAIVATSALVFSAGAAAIIMSTDEYKAGKAGIAAAYNSAKAACDSFSGNAKRVCRAEAKGKQNVAKAELEAQNKPSENASYKVRVARADANYSVARENCNDTAGNVKDVCLKEAKADAVAAKADAKAQLTISNANQVADDKTTAARATASGQRATARQDAATVKRNADYAVARERCDTFADDAKVACIKDAKLRFGQS